MSAASDCYLRLDKLEGAIKCRPDVDDEWIQDIRSTLESRVRENIASGEFIEAVGLLKSVKEAWLDKSQVAEVQRTERLLSEAVKTARSAFETELKTTQSAPDLLKRWSLMEEMTVKEHVKCCKAKYLAICKPFTYQSFVFFKWLPVKFSAVWLYVFLVCTAETLIHALNLMPSMGR